jgi:hypothetical protein
MPGIFQWPGLGQAGDEARHHRDELAPADHLIASSARAISIGDASEAEPLLSHPQLKIKCARFLF